MERRGLLIDPVYFKKQAVLAEGRAEALEHQLNEWTLMEGGGIVNWRSSVQEIAFLHTHLHLPESPVCGKGKTKKGKVTVDGKAVEWLRDYAKKKLPSRAWATELDKLIELKKCYSAIKYLNKFPLHADSQGYIHCNMQPDTETFRLAARCPELQQVPVRKEKDPYHIRKGFIAPEGYTYLVADQSQLEMRIKGHLLLKMFKDDSLIKDILAKDCHGQNAIRIYGRIYPTLSVLHPVLGCDVLLSDLPGEFVKKHPNPVVQGYRETIKAIAYGLAYGMTPHSLGAHLKDPDGEPIGFDRAEVLYNMYLDLYPSEREFQRWAGEFARRNGGMYDLVGGFRNIPEYQDERKWIQEAGNRKAGNTPMQRGAANIMSLAMVRVENNLTLRKLGYVQRLQIHDELDGYCPEGNEEECMAEIKKEMEAAMDLLCPLEVEPGQGKNWYEAK